MLSNFCEDHWSYIEAERENLEEVKLMVVREGHKLVKILPDWDMHVSVLEVWRGPPRGFRDEVSESVEVGHREVRRSDEFVQPGEICDGARSSRSFGYSEEVCREAGL